MKKHPDILVESRDVQPPFTAEELAAILKRVIAPVDFSEGLDITPDDLSNLARELLKDANSRKK